MAEPYVKHVELAHGLRAKGKRFESALEDILPFQLEPKYPVEGREDLQALTISSVTLGQALKWHKEIGVAHRPGTPGYSDELLYKMVAERVTPQVSKADLDAFSRYDYNTLETILMRGQHPKTGQNVFLLKKGAETVRDAYLRLPTRKHERLAEHNSGVSREEDAVRYESYLIYSLLHLGEAETTSFSLAGKWPFDDFLNLSWNDYLLLLGAFIDEDSYAPLTDILEGPVHTEDGHTLPFQDLPAPESQAVEEGSN